MRQLSFRLLDLLCAQLLHAKLDPARIDKLVAAGIRQSVIDKDTLPLILQKTAVSSGEWCLALHVLQSPHLKTHRIRLDDNIWPIILKGVPQNDVSKQAALTILKRVYKKRPLRTPAAPNSQ